MSILPYRTFTIETPLAPADALAQLRTGVEPLRWLRFSRAHRPFEGVVTSDAFTVQRIVHYQTDFLPRVFGRVEAIPGGGARLSGRLQLRRFTVVFMGLWFSGVALGCVGTLVEIVRGEHLGLWALVPFVMLLFGLGLTWGSVEGRFVPEAQRTVQELARLVNAARSDLQ